MQINYFKVIFFSCCMIASSMCFATHPHAKHKKATKHHKKPVVAQTHAPHYAIQHWVTEKGTDVYFLPTSELPMVDILVAYTAGSSRDDKLSGIATLTNSLLDEGTIKHTADQIAEGFDNVGAQYSNDASRDMAVVGLRSLTNKKLLDKAVDLFSEVITQPKFAENDFSRERNKQLAALQQESQSPSDIAINHFYKTLYGKHPYANPVLGSIKTLLQLSARHAKEFFDKYYTAQNATIAIVGKIDRNTAEQIVNKLMLNMTLGRKAPKFSNTPPLTNALSEMVTYPAKQTNILIGQLGISRDSPDYFPLLVGNYSFGGGSVVSRLFDEVREKRGLSYSTHSQFIPMLATGPFIISLGTRTNQAQQALTVTNEVLRKFVKNGPTAAELIAAKKNINGSYALMLDSNQALANNILALGFYDLPLHYLDTYQAKVNAVTLAQVRKAFQQHINPDKLVTVQVGETTQAAAHTSSPSHAAQHSTQG